MLVGLLVNSPLIAFILVMGFIMVRDEIRSGPCQCSLCQQARGKN